MTCPHCGAEAPEGPKFCPKCSRLLDSPLLRIKQELDAARGRPLHLQVADAAKERAAALAARMASQPPPVPDQPAVYRLQNAGPSVHQPFPQTPSEQLGRAERAEQARGKRKKQRQPASTFESESHSTPGHRFDPTAQHHPTHGAQAAQQHNAQQKAQAAAKAKAKAAAEVPPPPERFARPAALTVLGLLDIFAAMACFAVFMELSNSNLEQQLSIVDSTRYVWGGLAGFFLVTGLTVLWRWRIGRLLQMLIALPMLAAPWTGGISVIYGIVVLFYLTRVSTKAIFAGKSPRQLTQAQWAGAHAALKFSPILAGLFFIFAIVPAMGIARLLVEYMPQAAAIVDRARAGESITSILNSPWTPASTPAASVEPEPTPTGDPQTTAVEEVVAVMRAQAAYASLNGGLYDRIECVVTPANCIPNGDPRNAAKLLEPRFTRMERNGYVFQLRLSEAPAERPNTVSKSGTSEYAYRAVPIKGEGPGFCGNQTGTICTFDAKNVSGDPFKCPEACTPLQRTEQP